MEGIVVWIQDERETHNQTEVSYDQVDKNGQDVDGQMLLDRDAQSKYSMDSLSGLGSAFC